MKLLLLLLLSHLSRVRLCVTPQMAAHQTHPSLGFSRQEHWSGLPFPSPIHESEKWKWSHSVVSDSKRSHGLQPTRLLCPWDFPGKSTGVGCHCLLHKWNYIQVILWNQKIRKYCFNLQAMEANTGGNWHGSKGLKDHLSQGWRGSTKWQGEIELGIHILIGSRSDC